MNTIATQSVNGSLADFVGGEFAYEVGVVAIVGAAYGYIGFTAAPDYVEIIYLNETFASCR